MSWSERSQITGKLTPAFEMIVLHRTPWLEKEMLNKENERPCSSFWKVSG